MPSALLSDILLHAYQDALDLDASASLDHLFESAEFACVTQWMRDAVKEIARTGLSHKQNDTRLIRSRRHHDCAIACDTLSDERLDVYTQAALAIMHDEVLRVLDGLENLTRAERLAQTQARMEPIVHAMVFSVHAPGTADRRTSEKEDRALYQKTNLLLALIAVPERLPETLSSTDPASTWIWFGPLVNLLLGTNAPLSPVVCQACEAKGFPVTKNGITCQATKNKKEDAKCTQAWTKGQALGRDWNSKNQVTDQASLAHAERAYEKRKNAASEIKELNNKIQEIRREIDVDYPEALAQVRLEIQEKQNEIRRLTDVKNETARELEHVIEKNEHQKDSSRSWSSRMRAFLDRSLVAENDTCTEQKTHLLNKLRTYVRAIDELTSYVGDLERFMEEASADQTMKKIQLDECEREVQDLRAAMHTHDRDLSRVWKPEDVLPASD